MWKIALILSVVVATAFSECLNPPPVKNFRRDAFKGPWRHLFNVGFPVNNTINPPCNTLNLTDNKKSAIEFTWVFFSKVESSHAVERSSKGGSFELTYANGEPVRLVVLDTDYKTFASVYICSEADPTHRNIAIYQRSRSMDQELIQRKLREAQIIVPLFEPRNHVDQAANCIN